MKIFPAYATDFECYPQSGKAFQQLTPLLSRLEKVDFQLTVLDPSVNQGQISSDFDAKFEEVLLKSGAKQSNFSLPAKIPQRFDFAFSFDGLEVAVEVEKANREKILRDILKAHSYLHSGADLAIIALPFNYPHSTGMWDLFTFGKERFAECERYGFGDASLLSRILLLGFKQFDTLTDKALSTAIRKQMRDQARG